MFSIQGTADAPVVDAKELRSFLDASELVGFIPVLVKENNICTFCVATAIPKIAANADFCIQVLLRHITD